MNKHDIANAINQHIERNSKLDGHRDYVGISQIGKCPRQTYKQFFHGISIDFMSHQRAYMGYEQEKNILELLQESHVAARIADNLVVAPFDIRLRGHFDGITRDGNFIEIKSVSVRKFEKVMQTHRAIYDHFAQVQLYMRYSKIRTTFIIYRCRETYNHHVIEVPYSEREAVKLEEKAKEILKAIDTKSPPVCTCGRCKEDVTK